MAPRFPRLPWNGAAVSDEDIAIIADWIDEGCPADNESGAIALDAENDPGVIERISVRDIAEFDVMTGTGQRRGYRQGELRQRPNLDCMSEEQVGQLREAFRKIYELDDFAEDRRSYNNQALIHQNHCQHGWERFLPWHRAYLYEFEQNLQDFSPDLSLPYWDWTMPQYWNDGAPQNGCVLPNPFKAYITETAADKLISGLGLTPASGQGAAFLKIARERKLFTTQREFFCYVINDIGFTDVTPAPADRHRRLLLDALIDSNALWYPLRYSAQYHDPQGHRGTINQLIHYHYPSPGDMAQISGLDNFRDFGGGPAYNAAFGFLDQNPHNTMHIWTGGMNPDAGKASYDCAPRLLAAGVTGDAKELGVRRNAVVRAAGRAFHTREDMYGQPDFGDMFSNLTASYDPIFWPIHVNVDRLWWEWQKRHPNHPPADLDSVLSPWSYTIRDTLNAERFGYEYVRGAYFMPVGMQTPIARFISKPIRVAAGMKAFHKAEVRLHWVPQLARSCFIRVFLNQPGADATTPINGNPNYAGYLAVFGHGECYGGPGHCDLPAQRAREFDVRPRSHNTPRNHRIDVSACARELLKKAQTLQITLLVIGVDYREEPDLLRLEGVSLNFLD
jgi:tyrosinase